MNYSFLAYFWLFFVSIQRPFHVASRSSRMIGNTALSETEDRAARITNEIQRKGEASKTIEDSLALQMRTLGGDASCNCKDYCLDPNSSELEKLVWIENNPIFCKKSGTIDIKNKPYVELCFFDCCRTCNGQYYNCVLKVARQACLKTAYECAGHCAKKSSLNITVKGW